MAAATCPHPALQCLPSIEGAQAATKSADPKCLRSDAANAGIWCLQCQPGFYFNTQFTCINTGTPLAKCQATSKNPKCKQCNPDGTCNLCTAATDLLLPNAAIFINVPPQESVCRPAGNVTGEARSLLSIPTWNPIANCIEYTNDFKCAQCKGGWTSRAANNQPNGFVPNAAGTACVAVSTIAAANRCPGALRYNQYCTKCLSNKCQVCAWGRVPTATGECRINCKQLFGIGCQTCQVPPAGVPAASNLFPESFPGTVANPGTCTKTDANYANGRR
ncbi:hypothetical protein ABPG77_001217 [Micractinium sp. CCAP 211/92]